MPLESEVRIPVGDRTMRAALALPDGGDAAGPGVIVIHEILGLNDDMRRIACRFASAGYAALAPDLFEGLGPRPICIVRTIRAYRRGGGRALAALDAARDWLSSHAEVAADRIGVAGFCMGGGFALLLGLRDDVGAAAAFYGEVPPSATELEGVCPVVAGFGGRDRIFGAGGQLLEQHLKQLGVAHDVVTYPEAGHSFMSQYSGLTACLAPLPPLRAGYEEAAAEDSWARMLAFFGRHLAATSNL
jgi:carboxymethylenebutenolidase